MHAFMYVLGMHACMHACMYVYTNFCKQDRSAFMSLTWELKQLLHAQNATLCLRLPPPYLLDATLLRDDSQEYMYMIYH